jgi:uroporphyrinogen III methyltransferase/synthase
VASVAVDPPTVMVVGAVAGLELGLAERRPLSGMTAVVTRPRHQAADIVAALGDAGAAVVVLPTVAIVDPEDGGRALHAAAAVVDGYDWLVCTSANAVDRVVEAVVDLRRLHGVRIAAVGPATAAALARHHLVADLVAATASGDGLVADLTATGVAGRRVLYPRSASARPTVADGLRALGCTVDDVVAYRSVTPERSSLAPTVLERAGEADVAVVASPSAVEGLVAVLGDGSSDAVPPVVAIGPVTAQAARRLGVTVAAEASDPSPAGLVAAVAMWWGSTPGGARPASGDVRRLGGGG